MDLRRILALAVATSLLPTLFTYASSYEKINVPGYFVFGDSLVDVGTNNYLPFAIARANFPPYGETFFHKPTGRFTNGRNIGDFIAQALKLPFAPPFLQPQACFTKGVNFASGGSGLLDTTNAGTVLPISVQLEQYGNATALLYKQLGAYGAQNLISRSIFVIASGSNDIDGGYLTKPEVQKQISATQYITLMIEAYQKTLITLFESGARKAVVFGLGPLGCSPIVRVANPIQPGECLIQGNQLAIGFNMALKQLVNGLRVAFPDFHIVFADSFNLVYSIITDGKQFGFTNVTTACCGAGMLNAQVQCGRPVPHTLPGVKASLCPHPYKFVFWDVIHPTEHVVKIIFNNIWTGDSRNVTYPINLRTLATL